MDREELKALVLSDMAIYVASYVRPEPADTFGGDPWSRERIAEEVEKMKEFLIEPRQVEYLVDEGHSFADRNAVLERRAGWSVAQDDDYQLVYDDQLAEFLLVADYIGQGLVCWGIRGGAPDCFIAR